MNVNSLCAQSQMSSFKILTDKKSEVVESLRGYQDQGFGNLRGRFWVSDGTDVW